MAGSGPHQTSPHHAKSANVRQQDELLNLEHEKDLDNYQEGSLQTLHTGGSGFWRKLHRAQRKRKGKKHKISCLSYSLVLYFISSFGDI